MTNYLEKLIQKYKLLNLNQLKHELTLKVVHKKGYGKLIFKEIDAVGGLYHGQDASFEQNSSCDELVAWGIKMDKLIAAQKEVKQLKLELYED